MREIRIFRSHCAPETTTLFFRLIVAQFTQFIPGSLFQDAGVYSNIVHTNQADGYFLGFYVLEHRHSASP